MPKAAFKCQDTPRQHTQIGEYSLLLTLRYDTTSATHWRSLVLVEQPLFLLRYWLTPTVRWQITCAQS